MTLAWHFLREAAVLAYPPHTLVEAGQTLTHDGPLVMCESGLHASLRAIDALQYAPGPIVCRVRVGGEIIRAEDKLVARERTVLAMADATDALRAFARQCASSVLHLWDAPQVVRDYLATGDESLRDAAGAAAGAAARDAAGAAARDAAGAAAWDAAGDAAWDAAWAAAGDAAWDAAWAAAGAAQNTRLEAALSTLLGGVE